LAAPTNPSRPLVGSEIDPKLVAQWREAQWLQCLPRVVRNFVDGFVAQLGNHCLGVSYSWSSNNYLEADTYIKFQAPLVPVGDTCEALLEMVPRLLKEGEINCLISESKGWLVVDWQIAFYHLEFLAAAAAEKERKYKLRRVKYT
jgi:hypothetical protein